jgi:hypothetical protein
MKKLLTLFFISLGCIILFSQEYTPLLKEGNFWEMTYTESEMYGNYGYTEQYRISDEIFNFNGKDYVGIESRMQSITYWPPFETGWTEWAINYYLYENTDERKVYTYYPSDNPAFHEEGEFILYDFNVNVGDSVSLKGFINQHDIEQEYNEVYEIAEGYFGTFGLKKIFYVNGLLNNYAEGVGNIGGLINIDYSIDRHYELSQFQTINYFPLLALDNRWIVSYMDSETGNYFHEYKIDPNQTLNINGKTFLGLDFRRSTTQPYEWSEWDNYGRVYFHEDLTHKKVYLFDNETNHEYLLYDFSLVQGNEIPTNGFLPFHQNLNENVVSINFVNCFSQHGTRTINSGNNDFKIYEGIGSTTGLFTLNTNSTLVDFRKNSTLTTVDFSQNSFAIVYPNPFTHQIQIDTNTQIQQLQLFDLTGNLIQTKSDLNELNVHLGGLKSGVYILTISYKNNTKESHKIIKK